MEEKLHGFFNDDGTPVNPDLMPKPSLCATCKHDNDPKQETLCALISRTWMILSVRLTKSNKPEYSFLFFGSFPQIGPQTTFGDHPLCQWIV